MADTFTKEKIGKLFEEIFSDYKKSLPRQIIVYRYCKGVGGTIREDALNLTLCNHPECVGCTTFHQALEEETKKFNIKP